MEAVLELLLEFGSSTTSSTGSVFGFFGFGLFGAFSFLLLRFREFVELSDTWKCNNAGISDGIDCR